MERGVCREGDVKLRSKEPAFLCSGSAPRAPCISASTGQEPARPWRDREHTSGPTAPWSTASAGSWGSWVGEVDGGERDFLLVDAPASSFRSPLFLSFFSFLLSSGLPPVLVGLGVDGPLMGPPPTSPLRLAALTLGGVMAEAADVSWTAVRGPGAPMAICITGWWLCCGDPMEGGLRPVVGRRDGELWVRKGDTVAVGRS